MPSTTIKTLCVVDVLLSANVCYLLMSCYLLSAVLLKSEFDELIYISLFLSCDSNRTNRWLVNRGFAWAKLHWFQLRDMATSTTCM
jgi:hypothetical protein